MKADKQNNLYRHLTFSDLNIKICYTQSNITKNHHFKNHGYKTIISCKKNSIKI